MNILFYTAGDNGAAWLDALSRAFPEARVGVWPKWERPIDYALVWRPPPALIADLANARAVFNLGAGVDAVPAISSWPQGVPLVRLEDAGMADQMAEYATYAVLRCYREFAAYEAAQIAQRWEPRPRLDKQGFGVGILGMGVLGTHVARALLPLGFPLYGLSRTRKELAGIRSCTIDELEPFLAACRVLVCMLPLTDATRGLLDRRRLSMLPPGAYVVNVARGPLLVERDLIALLDSGHLSGAMLDVFDSEPLPPGHAFWHHPKVVLTPHVSALTSIAQSLAQIRAKVDRLEAGLPISGVVDTVRAY